MNVAHYAFTKLFEKSATLFELLLTIDRYEYFCSFLISSLLFVKKKQVNVYCFYGCLDKVLFPIKGLYKSFLKFKQLVT